MGIKMGIKWETGPTFSCGGIGRGDPFCVGDEFTIREVDEIVTFPFPGGLCGDVTWTVVAVTFNGHSQHEGMFNPEERLFVARCDLWAEYRMIFRASGWPRIRYRCLYLWVEKTKSDKDPTP